MLFHQNNPKCTGIILPIYPYRREIDYDRIVTKADLGQIILSLVKKNEFNPSLMHALRI